MCLCLTLRSGQERQPVAVSLLLVALVKEGGKICRRKGRETEELGLRLNTTVHREKQNTPTPTQ